MSDNPQNSLPTGSITYGDLYLAPDFSVWSGEVTDKYRQLAKYSDIQDVNTAIALKQSTSEKNQVNGYLGLDSSGLVDPAKIHTGTTARFCTDSEKAKWNSLVFNTTRSGAIAITDTTITALFIREQGYEGLFRLTTETVSPGTGSYNWNKITTASGRIYQRVIQDGNFHITWAGIQKNQSGTDVSSDINNFINQVVDAYGGGNIILEPGIYYGQGFIIPAYITIVGVQGLSKFRFKPSGDDSTDATKYTVISQGSFSGLQNVTIDGNTGESGVYAVGNGLQIIPDDSALRRSFVGLRVEGFAGYKASPTTGTYGVNKNYSRDDISNGTGGHLLAGGNAIVITPGSGGGASSAELLMMNVRISKVDGMGIDMGAVTDSKFIDFWIGNCVNLGVRLGSNNGNCQFTNFKVYRCRMLNPSDDFSTSTNKIIPHETTVSTDSGAVIFTGSGHQVANFEVQECGSFGIQIGNSSFSCSNSRFEITVDGNGGYDATADATTALNYKRYGVFLYNYYGIILNGVASDFRAKYTYPRQLRGVHVQTRKTFTTASSLVVGNYYRIKDTSGAADFTPLQQGYASPSNAVGTVFQYRNQPGASVPSGVFGSGGILEAVNDKLMLNMIINDQYEQDQLTGPGYNLDNDGLNSSYAINGSYIKKSPDGTIYKMGVSNTPSTTWT
jgi:hypothetical protein